MNIRPLRESDFNFVLSTWMTSYLDGIQCYLRVQRPFPFPNKGTYYKGHEKKIKELLARPEISCMVAVSPDDDNQIVGWIVFDTETLHYCYVKHFVRKLGIAKRLKEKLPKTVSLYSHHTGFTRYIKNGLRFDPYKF